MRNSIVSLVLAGAALILAPRAEAQDLLNTGEIIKALPGVWAMEIAIPPETDARLQCEKAAIRISYETGPNDEVIYVSQHVGSEPLPAGESGIARSKIEVGPRALSIVLQYEGETRLDDKGKPVRWRLLMTDRDTFYWNREDWADGGVTAPSHRCPDPDLIG
jgi:hypothetical protein